MEKRSTEAKGPVAGVHREPSTCARAGCIKFGELFESHAGSLVGMPWPEACRVELCLVEGSGVSVVDAHGARMWKSEAAIEALLRRCGMAEVGLRGLVENPVPAGVGCATSTTNVKLVTSAAAALLGSPLDPRWIARVAAQIEPTDAITLIDGSTCIWDFYRARPLSRAFRLPAGTFVGAFPRGRVLDTDGFAGGRPVYTERQRSALEDMTRYLPAILRLRCLEGVACISSLSADINQQWFPKAEIEVMRMLRSRGQILGYWTAHTGTAFGAIAAPGRCEATLQLVADAIGAGFEVSAFEYERSFDRLPFLHTCGNRLIRCST